MNIVENYRDIALQNTPMIDVRAPVEYDKGTILASINLPLMSDEERRLVGICYKEQGQQQAITLGHQLVSGDIKDRRIDSWCQYFDQHPNAHIFCYRGGLRSKTSQQWITESGRDIPLIKGGYKAFRQYLIQATESIVNQMPITIISGKTGCGKTELLDALDDIVDLEGLANHRGSSFGKNISAQPSQINFENQLAKRLLQIQQNQQRNLIVEDESRTIGRCALPEVLRDKMQQSPVYLLEDDIQSRVQRILQDYVINMDRRYREQFGEEEGFNRFSDYLENAFNGIKRRLGALRHTQLLEVLHQSLKQQQSQNDPSKHVEWIEVLLSDYYDPMYQYQLTKKQDRIIHRGTKEQLLDLLKQQREQNL
jgi:tRNA 2-selenouridine synthase